MIVLGKDKTLDNYFIDENGVITDENGIVQTPYINQGRLIFKSVGVHQIQMWTNFGWRDGYNWVVHHLDEDKLNNSISNLIFLTRPEHNRLHKKGKHHSEETKQKISKATKGQNNPLYGKHHSKEAKLKMSKNHKGKHHSKEAKLKMSKNHKGLNTWTKGLHWFNDGVRNYRCKECPIGCVEGRIKWKN